MRLIRKRSEDPRIEITPLIDTMFILVIFVLITAQYRAVTGLKVNLPQAKSAKAVEKGNYLVVTITRGGGVLLNGEKATLESLENRLRAAKKGMENPFVLIQADEGTTTRELVGAMDAASKAGLPKISIETRRSS